MAIRIYAFTSSDFSTFSRFRFDPHLCARNGKRIQPVEGFKTLDAAKEWLTAQESIKSFDRFEDVVFWQAALGFGGFICAEENVAACVPVACAAN